ncbi:hypothetical protein D3C78_1299930 [compost metagenome]
MGAALKRLETRIQRPQASSLICCDYTDMGAVEALISAHQGQLLTADYGQQVRLQVSWDAAIWTRIAQELTDRTHGRVSLRPLDG